MKKYFWPCLALLVLFLAACTKEGPVKQLTKPAFQKKSPDPVTAAQFMAYVGVMRYGDPAKHRFTDFPDVPLEVANELFDNIFAVYVPLREDQPGGVMVEHTLKVYPEPLQIIEDENSVTGYSYAGYSVADFLTIAIDEIVDYVNEQDLPGYKYIAYIYTTVDSLNQYDIHFGLVNKDEEYDPVDPENSPGDLACTAPSGMYDPATTGRTIMSIMLNSEECNRSLRWRLRSENASVIWPPDPRELGQLAPCTDVVLAYSGYNGSANTQSELVKYTTHDLLYDSGTYPRYFWSEDLTNPSSVSLITHIDQDDIHKYGSAISFWSTSDAYFPWVDNYYDPVGYSGISVLTESIPGDMTKYYHQVRITWQQLRWVSIPDPGCWGFTIATSGVTSELNP